MKSVTLRLKKEWRVVPSDCVCHVFGKMRGVLAAVSQLVKDRLPQSTIEALLCNWVTLTMSSSAEVSGQ